MQKLSSTVEFYDWVVACGAKTSPEAMYPVSVCAFAEAVIQACREDYGLDELVFERYDDGRTVPPALATALLSTTGGSMRPMPSFRVGFAGRIYGACQTVEAAYRIAVPMVGLAHDADYLVEAQTGQGGLLISRPAFEDKFGVTVCVQQECAGGVFPVLSRDESQAILKEMGLEAAF